MLARGSGEGGEQLRKGGGRSEGAASGDRGFLTA